MAPATKMVKSKGIKDRKKAATKHAAAAAAAQAASKHTEVEKKVEAIVNVEQTIDEIIEPKAITSPIEISAQIQDTDEQISEKVVMTTITNDATFTASNDIDLAATPVSTVVTTSVAKVVDNIHVERKMLEAALYENMEDPKERSARLKYIDSATAEYHYVVDIDGNDDFSADKVSHTGETMRRRAMDEYGFTSLSARGKPTALLLSCDTLIDDVPGIASEHVSEAEPSMVASLDEASLVDAIKSPSIDQLFAAVKAEGAHVVRLYEVLSSPDTFARRASVKATVQFTCDDFLSHYEPAADAVLPIRSRMPVAPELLKRINFFTIDETIIQATAVQA
ncbi:hypothetical protein ACEQ8H_004748 [Pleosporales sp. CAS-2024a]